MTQISSQRSIKDNNGQQSGAFHRDFRGEAMGASRVECVVEQYEVAGE